MHKSKALHNKHYVAPSCSSRAFDRPQVSCIFSVTNIISVKAVHVMHRLLNMVHIQLNTWNMYAY
jgi:hypothetical protein